VHDGNVKTRDGVNGTNNGKAVMRHRAVTNNMIIRSDRRTRNDHTPQCSDQCCGLCRAIGARIGIGEISGCDQPAICGRPQLHLWRHNKPVQASGMRLRDHQQGRGRSHCKAKPNRRDQVCCADAGRPLQASSRRPGGIAADYDHM
jgi:hypothetical protein